MMFTTIFAALFAASTLTYALPTPNNNADETSIIEERDLLARAGATVYTKCSKSNVVALTFDDGPYTWNKLIVDTLSNAGAKGTFFWNGNNYGCIYDPENVTRIKYAYSKGHQVASHTWSHPHLNSLSSAQIKTELTKVDTAFKKILGLKAAFVRPPYGEYNQNVRNVAGANGQSLVNWSFDSGDSIGESVSQSEADYTKLINQHPSNILALNHETYSGTAHTLLPFAIKALKAKGYKLVTVAECLGKSPYVSTGAAGKKDSTWHC